MTRRIPRPGAWAALVLAAALGCGDDSAPPEADSSTPPLDDAGALDATPPPRDAGPLDAADAASPSDAGDAAPRDAGADLGLGDAGEPDAGDGCALSRPAWGRGGAAMFPGTDCGSCHRAGGRAGAHPFTVSGTVFASATCPEGVPGAIVHVEDAERAALSLVANEAGNFFTAETLVPPLGFAVEIDGVVTEMGTRVEEGSCGACHLEGSRIGYVAGSR